MHGDLAHVQTAHCGIGGRSIGRGQDEDGIVNSIQAVVQKLVPKEKVSAPRASRPKNRGGILIKTTPKGAKVKPPSARVGLVPKPAGAAMSITGRF